MKRFHSLSARQIASRRDASQAIDVARIGEIAEAIDALPEPPPRPRCPKCQRELYGEDNGVCRNCHPRKYRTRWSKK